MTKTVFLIGSWAAVVIAVVAAFFGGELAAVAVAGVIAAIVILGGIFMLGSHERAPRPVLINSVREDSNAEAGEELAEAPQPGMPSKKLGMYLLFAVALHLMAVGVLNLTSLNRALAPDSVAFRYCGKFIAESWADPSYDATWHNEGRPKSEICPTYKARSFYQHLNGVVEYLIGVEKVTHVLLGFVNMLVGFLAAFIFAKTSERLFGKYAGQVTFLLIVFFPSLIVWTSINLRESWSFLLLAVSMWTGMNLRERFNPRDLVLFFATIGAMVTVRGYLVAVIAMAMVISYVAVRIRQIPAAIITIGICFFAISQLAARFGISATDIDVTSQLEMANHMRRGLAYGGSSFGTDVDISTPSGALIYLPKGMALFLLAPFPWSLDSWRQILAVGETMVWYWLLFRALRQLFYSIRHELARVALPVALLLIICVAYGLVEGNAGTAYRHRAHATLIFLMFAGGDFAKKRRERTAPEIRPEPAVPLLLRPAASSGSAAYRDPAALPPPQ
jgi:hypothetical protein